MLCKYDIIISDTKNVVQISVVTEIYQKGGKSMNANVSVWMWNSLVGKLLHGYKQFVFKPPAI